ncbi:hypothetical protein MPER_11734, partial [Moniliophthora perniciosa FA553]
ADSAVLDVFFKIFERWLSDTPLLRLAKDENQARAVETIDAAFTSVLDAEFQVECVPATACISLLWQYGDRHYNAKRWPEAAEWFLAGTHRLLMEVCPASVSKCYRKAALCYIEHKEYAKAAAVIRCCPNNEAATQYVTFLTAIHQGLEDEAIEALHRMVEAPDFDRKMLLLATQLSHKSEMKSVLLIALEALLKTLKTSQSGETILEAMTLLRCVIRLSLKLLVEPTANKSKLIDNVVKHFHTATVLVDAAREQKATALIIKDISWLWRTANNSAVQGCSEWEGYQDQICSLFEAPRDTPLRTRISEILEKDRISDESDTLRAQYILFSLRVFEVEMLVMLKEWDDVLQVIGSVGKSGPLAVGTFEAIADLLWTSKDCPINDHNALSVEKFSRWLRAICTIILARNSPADRLKVIGYVEQAATVMEEHSEGDEAYPMDERFWLLGTSYNTGLECLEASLLEEAK